jgi:nucleotide-binding universal stress UspA family protein
MPIHEILFPTDFSEAARYAGCYAALLARKLGARLHALHVPFIPFPATPSDLTHLAGAEPYEAGRRKAEAQLEELLRAEDWRTLRVRRTVTLGLVEDEILKAAEGTTLIVMGTHGRTGIARAMLGSVTEKVVRMAPCPVLTVKHPEIRVELPWGVTLAGRRRLADMPRLQSILVPLDRSTLAERILAEVRELARPLEAMITLLRVIPPYLTPSMESQEKESARDWAEVEAYLQEKRQALQAAGVSVNSMVRTGDPAHQILEYAEANEIDVIAIATHGRSGLSRWLLGSVADKVLRGSDIPILLFRAWSVST